LIFNQLSRLSIVGCNVVFGALSGNIENCLILSQDKFVMLNRISSFVNIFLRSKSIQLIEILISNLKCQQLQFETIGLCNVVCQFAQGKEIFFSNISSIQLENLSTIETSLVLSKQLISSDLISDISNLIVYHFQCPSLTLSTVSILSCLLETKVINITENNVIFAKDLYADVIQSSQPDPILTVFVEQYHVGKQTFPVTIYACCYAILSNNGLYSKFIPVVDCSQETSILISTVRPRKVILRNGTSISPSLYSSVFQVFVQDYQGNGIDLMDSKVVCVPFTSQICVRKCDKIDEKCQECGYQICNGGFIVYC
jgi:hypothetical protein